MYRNIWISLLQAYAAGHAGRGAALQMYRYLLVFAAETRTQNLRRAGLSSLVSARARPPCSGIRYKCRERGRATSSGLVRNSPIASRLQAVLVSWEAGHRICDLVGLFSRVSSSAKHGPAQHQGGAAFFLLGPGDFPTGDHRLAKPLKPWAVKPNWILGISVLEAAATTAMAEPWSRMNKVPT